MTQRKSSMEAPAVDADGREPFGDGQIWFGEHTADGDVLVFDPAESDPHADVLSLYSLAQHRTRSFPRATVIARIRPMTDELARARAEKEYAQRGARRAAHEQAQTEADAERADRQRDGVVAAHARYIEAIGAQYQGVRETADVPKGGRRGGGRRTKCHVCGIGLDDFAGAVCLTCEGVLCSCGACGCKSRIQSES